MLGGRSGTQGCWRHMVLGCITVGPTDAEGCWDWEGVEDRSGTNRNWRMWVWGTPEWDPQVLGDAGEQEWYP